MVWKKAMYQINYWLLYQIKTTEQVYQIKEKEWEVGGETAECSYCWKNGGEWVKMEDSRVVTVTPSPSAIVTTTSSTNSI